MMKKRRLFPVVSMIKFCVIAMICIICAIGMAGCGICRKESEKSSRSEKAVAGLTEKESSKNTGKAVDLLTVCDYLITDYSAIAVEGAVLNKQTYYYVYDYDEYDEKNGLNINLFETMPGCVFRKASDLAEALERDEYPQELLDEYRRKYLPERMGVSTKTISNIIIEKMGKKQ